MTHWKRPWCWERLKVGGEGDDRGWDGWMASPTRWTWVWVSSGSQWWTGKPGMLQFMGSQRVGHDWAAELNLHSSTFCFVFTSAIPKVKQCLSSGIPWPLKNLFLLVKIHLLKIYGYPWGILLAAMRNGNMSKI